MTIRLIYFTSAFNFLNSILVLDSHFKKVILNTFSTQTQILEFIALVLLTYRLVEYFSESVLVYQNVFGQCAIDNPTLKYLSCASKGKNVLVILTILKT